MVGLCVWGLRSRALLVATEDSHSDLPSASPSHFKLGRRFGFPLVHALRVGGMEQPACPNSGSHHDVIGPRQLDYSFTAQLLIVWGLTGNLCKKV